MTGRIYMENDYRRDHSFRVPRPDQSALFGTPNACNDCHTDQTAQWAALAVEDWYGSDRPSHFTDVLLSANAGETGSQTKINELIADESQPEIIRATAVWYAGQFPNNSSNRAIQDALRSDSDLVKISAAKAVEKLPPEMRRLVLTGLLNDERRAVRIFAFRSLASFSDEDFDQPYREHFRQAMQEYKSSLEISRYFPQGAMNRGQFFEQRGDTDEAIRAYREAIERDSYFNPARINLAYLLNGEGENEEAESMLRTVIEQEPEFGEGYYSLGLLLAEMGRLEEAVTFFDQAAVLMVEPGRVYYNLAIAQQTLENPQAAEAAYLKAIEREPRNGDFRYGLVTLYMQQQEYPKALEQARELENIYPENTQINQLLDIIRQNLDL